MREKLEKLGVLFSLYIAQSIPMSFFSTVVPVIMRQESYSLQAIGLLQLIKLPWIFKFLWAPLVDRQSRSMKQLRGWIYVSELFYALVIVMIGLFNLQFDFKLIVGLMLLAFIASATQDIATDAYAILILKREERSHGNSIQAAGSFIGTLAGSGLLLMIYHYFGWQMLLFALGSFAVLALIPLLIHSGKDKDIVKEPSSVNLKDLINFFSVQGMGKRVVVLLLVYTGLVGSLAMIKPWLVDMHYSVKEIGFMSGIVGTAVGSLCALFAGWIINKMGRERSFRLFSLFAVVAACFLWLISLGTPTTGLLYSAIILIWGSYGFLSVSVFTTSMDCVREGREGTDFTLQIVLTHLSGLLLAVISGKIADHVAYQGLFLFEFCMALIASLTIFLFVKPKNTKP